MKSRVRLGRAWACLLLGTLAVSVPRGVLAQPSAEDRAASEVLFNEALKLIESQETSAACPKLEESQRLDPQTGTLLYLATCHEQIGRTASAWAEFKDALAQAQTAGRADRVAQAEQGVLRVEPMLSKLSVKLNDAAPDQKVLVNGRELRSFEVALPYDPGPITIVAEAPGRQRFEKQIELGKGPVSELLEVPALAAVSVAVVPEPEVDHTLAFIVGGAGLGVTAVGLAFGGVALAEKGSADDNCDGSLCTQEGLDGHDRANGWAWASTITTGVGLAAVGVGVILFFVSPEVEGAPGPASAHVPVVLPSVWQSERGSFITGVSGSF